MVFVVILCLLLQGCVTMVASNVGMGIEALSTAQTIDQAKTAADVVSYGATHKTLNDHALDAVTGKDCKLTNVVNKDHEVCKDKSE